LSTKTSTGRRTSGFGSRLAEAFGTHKPARIAEKLGVTYQAAKNYLEGRVPSPDTLLAISDSTGYSIHWLLTGVGPKQVTAETSPGETGGEVMGILRRLEQIERKLSLEDRGLVDSLMPEVEELLKEKS
jgi:transcriptional regulator with XRE-family HTH domain